MDLLVDIGNTRLKWACLNDGFLGSAIAVVHRDRDFEEVLSSVWVDLPRPDRLFVANVGGESRARALNDWVQFRWDAVARFVRSEFAAYGVTSGYRDPAMLGVDRWVCLVALSRLRRFPACVVDCGTAITLDFVDAGGIHRGGVIAPGVSLMREALFSGTSDLFRADGVGGNWLADNTGTAIENGTLLAAAGFVELGVASLRKRVGEPLPLILTGGDAERVAACIEIDAEIIPELVLQGLAAIAEAT